MLANRLAYAVAAIAMCSSWTGLTWAQSPTLPSQKTTPAPVSPPSVHIPTARQRAFANLNDAGALDSANSSRVPRTGTNDSNPPRMDRAVHPTAFQEDRGGNETAQVPEVLRNGNRIPPANSLGTGMPSMQRPTSTNLGFRVEEVPSGQPIQNPAAVDNQSISNSQVASPATGGNPRPGQLPAIQLPTQSPVQSASPSKTGTQAQTPMRQNPGVDGGSAVPPGEMPAAKLSNPGNISNTGSGSFTTQIRASSFDKSKRDIAAPMPPAAGGMIIPAGAATGNRSTDSRVTPTAMFVAGSSGASANNALNHEQPAKFALATPSIQLETYGPETIGIHKKSQFKIVAKNQSPVDAERLTVAITLPTWIRLENVNATTGRKEVGEDQKSSRVIWSIDRISPNSTQTLSVDVVPGKAEMFDVQVELVQQPRVGMAHVEVTEPRLDMKIAGPTEVLYGETATYQVAVRNPGTGVAEAVTVMLPEALGGERASLGDIGPGEEKNFRVELLARTAGTLDLATTATAAGNLQTSAAKQILVRRAALEATIKGPAMKYAGAVGVYDVEIKNQGDATAREVIAALAVPNGVRYLEGIDAVDVIESGLRWTIGTLDAGDSRQYRIALQLNVDGQIQMELGARAQGEISAVGQVATQVETVSDLVLAVEDPKGPLPTGQNVDYQIHVRNRGSRAARNLTLVMNFSEGIEPSSANGLGFELRPGQVVFTNIPEIAAGEEVVVQVTAQANQPGTHIFRAQLTGDGDDVREMAEGTTRFYGDEMPPTSSPATGNTRPISPGGGTFSGQQ